MNRLFNRFIPIIVFFCLIFSVATGSAKDFLLSEAVSRPYETGVNETKFAKAITDFLTRASDVHDVVVVKDSKIIFEATKYPYKKDIPHSMMSCSKSVASILTGIAIEEGFIETIDAPLYQWFPQLKNNPLKSQLTIYHLLSMTVGLNWNESGLYGERDSYIQMLSHPDPIAYFLSLDMDYRPGTFFEYNSGATVLLGVILERATGMDLLDFARTRLFDPLSINKYEWLKLSSDNRNAASSLYLTAKEMAMIGTLMLNKGVANEQQIVSEQWVERSTKKNMSTPRGPAGNHGYGFSWWMNSNGGFSARGYGGQFILVYPEQDLVVVTTGGLFGNDFYYPDTILGTGILNALNDPLEDETALNACYDEFAQIKKRNYAINPEELPFIDKIVQYESDSIVKWSPSKMENAIDLHLVINNNIIDTTIPLDGTYVQIDFGDFGNYQQNLAMIALENLTKNSAELIVRRFQSPYIYRYVLKYFGDLSYWTTYVSNMGNAFEQYSGSVKEE